MDFLYRALLCCGTAGSLAACAGVPLIDWEHGARRGEIVEFINIDTPGVNLPPCLAALPSAERSGRRFVKVQRFQRRFMGVEIAEVAAGVSTALGTQVEIFPADCDAGKLARVTRALSAK